MFFLAMSGVGMCRSYQRSDREQDERARRAAYEKSVAAVIGAVHDWPRIGIAGASNATASLRTVCRGWSSITPGTFQYELTVSGAQDFEKELKSPWTGSLNAFTIEFLDKDNFKVRDVPIGWRDLVRNAADAGSVTSLSARGGLLFCGPEVSEYVRWNLVYAPIPAIFK